MLYSFKDLGGIMSYVYDINTSKKDNRSTVSLTCCHLIYNIITIFISTFLVAHIYTLTTDIFSYTMKVATYMISAYVVMLISYYLFSFVVDKTNRIWVYRLGNIFNAILVIVTIFYGKDLAKIVILAGGLRGLAEGTYYASYNVIKQEMVSRNSMEKFSVITSVLNKVVGVVCPILLGYLIDVSTFSMVACYVLVLCLILIGITFLIKSKRPAESGFNIKEYFKRLKANDVAYKKIKSVYIMSFLFAIATATRILLEINVMMLMESNFSFGLMSGIFALVSAIVLILITKFTHVGKRKSLFILSAVLPVISAVIFAINPNVLTLAIYNAFFVITDIINSTILGIYRNKNLTKYHICMFFEKKVISLLARTNDD